MSAINCFVTPTAAHVFTDGALCEHSNFKVKGFGNKALAIPHLNAVLGATGFYWVSLLLVSKIAEKPLSDFDDLAGNLAAIVQECVAELRNIPTAARAEWGAFEVVIAGWSAKTDAPAAYYLRSFSDHIDEPAFVTRPATRFASPGRADRWDSSIMGLKFDPEQTAESGLALMEIQRANFYRSRNSDSTKMVRGIGGFCQHTMVERDSITTKVLKRWPDQIGFLIRPR